MMAHDGQYKEPDEDGIKIIAYDYPKPGDRYWSRVHHKVCTADKEMCVKCAIVERALP